MSDQELYEAALAHIHKEPIPPLTEFIVNGNRLKWVLDYSCTSKQPNPDGTYPRMKAHITMLIEREFESPLAEPASKTYSLYVHLRSLTAKPDQAPLHLVNEAAARKAKKERKAKGSRNEPMRVVNNPN